MTTQSGAVTTALPELLTDLQDADPQIWAAIADEQRRQESTLEMIASENFAPISVMQAQGAVPFAPRPPMVSSGVRIGTPALATRGLDLEAFREVADIISLALRPDTDDTSLDELRGRVDVLTRRFPLYPTLTTATL